MSWDVISCDEKWTCQKWSCDELGCDKYCAMPRERQPGSSLYTAPATRSQPRPSSQAGVAAGAHARRSCTVPATRKAARKLSVLRLPREASRGPAAPTRAAAPPGGSVDCACHTKPAAAQRRPRAAAPPGGSVYCAGHAKGSQEALCTAPAMRSQPRPSGAHARRSSSRRLCVLRRPRERQLGTRAAGYRSRRLCVLRLPRERQPGSSLYCACHAK